MKKLIIAICLIVLSGCGFNPESKNEGESIRDGDFTIKTIDSCEYIEYENGFGDMRVYSLTHKGNCKYCTQRNKI